MRKAEQGKAPDIIDHTAAQNPYESLHGNNWREVIRNTTALSAYGSINHLIDHVFTASRDVFAGTKYENKWFVYHDALSLLTSAASIEYIKEKGFFKHLILPENGLNDGTCYANRVVGSHPEMMPLDAHLNADIHKAVDNHAIITKHLPKEHPLKFSKRTPKHMSSAYKRLWDISLGPYAGVPNSKRICEDIERIIDKTYIEIVNNRGMALCGPHTCTGRRRNEIGGKGRRGGVSELKR